jgi:hypothetical protein
MREKTPTFLDAVARSPRTLILFECKFSENDGGACSQTRPLPTGRRKGLRQCNGHYVPQVNPANKLEGRCALSAKGIAYWDFIPDVFGYSAETSIAPCPFAGPWFQWMRNLTTAYAVAKRHRLQPAFVMAFADGPGLAMAQRIQGADWQWLGNRVDPAYVSFRALSIQQLLHLASQAVRADPILGDLTGWVRRKIDSVCGERVTDSQVE